MIDLIVKKFVDGLQCELEEGGISLTALYHPDTYSILHYSRNYLTRDMTFKLGREEVQEGKLMYSIGTPVPSQDHSQAIPQHEMSLITSGSGSITTTFSAPGPNDPGNLIGTMTKSKASGTTSSNAGGDKLRGYAYLTIPVSFAVVQESSDLLYEISILYYRVLRFITAFGLEIQFEGSSDSTSINYGVAFDPEIDITYANLDDNTSKHILTFSVRVSGAVVSQFYTTFNPVSSIGAKMAFRP